MKNTAFALLLLVLVAGRARAEEAPAIDLDGCPILDAAAARRAIRAELTVPADQRARLAELHIVITCPDAEGAVVEIRSPGASRRQRFAFGDLVGTQRLRLLALVVAELAGLHTPPDRPASPVATPDEAQPPGSRATRSAWTTELGASFVAGGSSEGITGGGSLELWVGPAASRWAGHLSLLALSRARRTLTPGSVSWTRPRAAIGARYRLVRGDHLALDLRADAMAAVLVLSGEGFTSNATATAFDPGLSAGVRLDVPFGRWSCFLEASALGWLRAHRAQVTGLADDVELPRAELLLQVGLTVALEHGN